MDQKTDHSTRIQALNGLHSLSKTYTLLIKDIPFVINMSKYYDKGILNSIYNDLPYNKTHLNNNYKIPNKKINNERNSNTIGEQDNQIDFTDLKDNHIKDTIESSKYENLDNKFTMLCCMI